MTNRTGVTASQKVILPWYRRVPHRRTLSVIVSLLLVLLGVLLLYHRIRWDEIAAVWSRLDTWLVLLAAGVYWLLYPINSLRLDRVVAWVTARSADMLPSFSFFFKLTCSAGFVTAVSPIGLAGDGAKVIALRLLGTLSTGDAVRSILFDRLVGMQWMCTIGLVTVPAQYVSDLDRRIILLQLALYAGPLLCIAVLTFLPRLLRLSASQFVLKLAHALTGYRAVLLPFRRSALQLLIATLNLATAGATLYLLLRAGGLAVDVWIVALYVPLLQVVNSLPFLYMGWGGREIAMASTLGTAAGLTVSEVLSISLVWGIVLVLTAAVNGVFLIRDWRLDRGRGPHDRTHRNS